MWSCAKIVSTIATQPSIRNTTGHRLLSVQSLFSDISVHRFFQKHIHIPHTITPLLNPGVCLQRTIVHSKME